MALEENKYLSSTQKIYLKLCELLGVNIFKKYWHVKGFFNKYTKLDKNNIFHLNMVIREADDFTNQHKSGLFAELFSLYIPTIGYGIYDLLTYKNKHMLLFSLGITSSCLLYHGYAFMVHQYNRIKANARIKFLEENNVNNNNKNDDIDIIEKEIDENNKLDKFLHINLMQRNESKYFNLQFKDFYDLRLKFVFFNLNEIIKFRQYIYDNIENVDINKLIIIYNTNKFKSLYENFIKINTH